MLVLLKATVVPNSRLIAAPRGKYHWCVDRYNGNETFICYSVSNKDRLSDRLAREPFAIVRKSETPPHSSVGRRLCNFVNTHSVEFTSVKHSLSLFLKAHWMFSVFPCFITPNLIGQKMWSSYTEKVETYVIGRSRKVNRVCFRVVNAKHLER